MSGNSETKPVRQRSPPSEETPYFLGEGQDGAYEDWAYVLIGDSDADKPAVVVKAPDIYGEVNKPIDPVTVTQEGGTPGGTWTITGLPRGLGYNEHTGVISGTPVEVVTDLPYTATYKTPNDGLETSGNAKSTVTDVTLEGPGPNYGDDYIIKILRVGETGEPSSSMKINQNGDAWTAQNAWTVTMPGLWYNNGTTRTPLTAEQIQALRVEYNPFETQPDGSFDFSGQGTVAYVADVDVTSGQVKLTGLKSGIARVTLSDGMSSYSFLVIVPGDITLDGFVDIDDRDWVEGEMMKRRPNPADLAYSWQHLVGDMDSDTIAAYRGGMITSKDYAVIEGMRSESIIPSN